MTFSPSFFAAFDLGASGGRLIIGKWDGKILSIEELHRFANEPVQINGTLYWDAPRLFHEMKLGLKKAAVGKIPLRGIGIDTWGLDYGLLDASGMLVSNPVHYRDERSLYFYNNPNMEWRGLYERTGIQNMPINTLYQLQADAEARPKILAAAEKLLFIPDLFTYFLTGKAVSEYTAASTSQLLNAVTKDWDEKTFAEGFNLDVRRLFCETVPPCTVVGALSDEVSSETGIGNEARVIAVGGHDTASAVAATPLTDSGCAYLSCGTWSLLGAELDAPHVTDKSSELNFTNEGGLDGKIRFLKNINGLWMIQQLRKSILNRNPGLELGFKELSEAAENANRKHFIIEPNDPSFANPPDMYTAVRGFCKMNNQGEPETPGEAAAAIYNGITKEYSQVITDLEAALDRKFHTLHMVGGGIKDTYLCRQTAKAIGRPVVAGPVEASALGNILAQMIGLGEISNITEGREIIRRSFKPVRYE